MLQCLSNSYIRTPWNLQALEAVAFRAQRSEHSEDTAEGSNLLRARQQLQNGHKVQLRAAKQQWILATTSLISSWNCAMSATKSITERDKVTAAN